MHSNLAHLSRQLSIKKKKKNQKGISIINYYINLLSLKKKKVHLSHYLSLRKKKKKNNNNNDNNDNL